MILVGIVGCKLKTSLARSLINYNREQHAVTERAAERRDRRGKERLSATTQAEVVRLYRAGLSLRQVAARLGLGRSTVLECLRRCGEPVRPPHVRFGPPS